MEDTKHGEITCVHSIICECPGFYPHSKNANYQMMPSLSCNLFYLLLYLHVQQQSQFYEPKRRTQNAVQSTVNRGNGGALFDWWESNRNNSAAYLFKILVDLSTAVVTMVTASALYYYRKHLSSYIVGNTTDELLVYLFTVQQKKYGYWRSWSKIIEKVIWYHAAHVSSFPHNSWTR